MAMLPRGLPAASFLSAIFPADESVGYFPASLAGLGAAKAMGSHLDS
jgi:hypothetical protein